MFNFSRLISWSRSLICAWMRTNLGKLRPVLAHRVRVLRAEGGLLLQDVLNDGAFTHRGDGIVIPGLRQLVIRLFVDALSLRFGQLLFDFAQFLRGDVAFLVDGPDLIFALVFQSFFFSGLEFLACVIKLAGQETGSFLGGVEVAIEIQQLKFI